MIHRYDLWMDLVNRKIENMYSGLNSDDFEDYLWRDAYDAGLTPSQAVSQWEDDRYSAHDE